MENRLGRSSLEKETEVSPTSQVEFKSAMSHEKNNPVHTHRSTAHNYVTHSSPLSWNTAPFWGISVEEAATWYKAQGRRPGQWCRAHQAGWREPFLFINNSDL